MLWREVKLDGDVLLLYRKFQRWICKICYFSYFYFTRMEQQGSWIWSMYHMGYTFIQNLHHLSRILYFSWQLLHNLHTLCRSCRGSHDSGVWEGLISLWWLHQSPRVKLLEFNSPKMKPEETSSKFSRLLVPCRAVVLEQWVSCQVLSVGSVETVESHPTCESKCGGLIGGISIGYSIGALCQSLLKEKAKKVCFFHNTLLLANYLPHKRWWI